MRRHPRVLSSLALGIIMSLIPTTAHAGVQDFTINSFQADYSLSRASDQSSRLHVIERITATFPATNQNHGILRAIPTTYQNHPVSLAIAGVTDASGTRVPYSEDIQNDNDVLRIGDASTYVHGLQTYIITYDERDVINFQQGQDEFYWDVNGTQWPQAMQSVIARLHIPSDLSSAFLPDKLVCYAGVQGSSQQNCQTSQTTSGEETVITASAYDLPGYQTLTFDTGFKPGTFAYSQQLQQSRQHDQLLRTIGTALAIILPVIAFIFCYRRWRTVGKDPRGRGVIIPEYLAPKSLNLLESGFILNENVTPKAMTATIIDLAVRGYLRILETKKKSLFKDKTVYSLEFTKPTADLSVLEQDFMNNLNNWSIALSGNPAEDTGLTPQVGRVVELEKLANHLYPLVKDYNKRLGQSLHQAGYFATNPKTVGSWQIFWSCLAIFFGLLTAFLASTFSFWAGTGLGVGAVISGIIGLVFGFLMPARTALGVTTRDYLKGLKEYMKLAEAERLRYVQSPEGAEKIQATGFDPSQPTNRVKLFESLLPYAILFGLEKDWAKQFENLYSEPPQWFAGNWTTFNTAYLVSSLSSFSSASAASFTDPSSSSGSGFGGGGFAGGGGGGGGGGGW